MGEITYEFANLTTIIENFRGTLAKIETFQEGLEARFNSIKTNWQDEADKIAERDENFRKISENMKSAHDELKQIVDLLDVKNEAFHKTGY